MSDKFILESPFANQDRNKFNNNYFYLCLVARKIMIENNASPLFFHALYTQFLNDDVQEERNLGLFNSFNWHSDGDAKLYAIDRGLKDSKGMMLGAADAIKKGMPVKFATAMPETHWISKRVAEINEIIDNQERWDAGLAFEIELRSIPENMERFEKNGELTDYVRHNQKDLEEVKNCIMEFFAPLVKAIEEERSQQKTDKAA